MSLLAITALSGIALVWLWMKIGKHGMQLIAALLVILVGYAFFVVHSISDSPLVASIKCVQVTNQPHAMVVTMNDKSYEMHGDRWMLQTSAVQVQPWMYFLGIKSGYTLDRLNSQYDDDNAHSQKPVELGGFSLYKATDLWRYIPLIRSAYGSGVIEPCDGEKYVVHADASGTMYAERGK